MQKAKNMAHSRQQASFKEQFTSSSCNSIPWFQMNCYSTPLVQCLTMTNSESQRNSMWAGMLSQKHQSQTAALRKTYNIHKRPKTEQGDCMLTSPVKCTLLHGAAARSHHNISTGKFSMTRITSQTYQMTVQVIIRHTAITQVPGSSSSAWIRSRLKTWGVGICFT